MKTAQDKMARLLHPEHEVRVHQMIVPVMEYADCTLLEKEPVVSVIMVTYNHEKYIGTAIESVLNQKTTYAHELIIGEDCSTDQTRKIVFDYLEKYPDKIRVITSKENVGMRRNGLRSYESARGKYIAFCEGDDYWHDPTKLQRQLDFLEQNSDHGLICSNARSHTVLTGTVVEKAIPFRPHLCQSDDLYTQLLAGVFIIWPLTVCMRTELLRTVHRECPECTDQNFLMGDTQRYLEIARRTKIKFVDESLATRNLLPESATQSRELHKKLRFSVSSKKLIYHYLDKYPVPACIDRQVRRAATRRCLYHAFVCRERKLGRAEMEELRVLGGGIPLRQRLYWLGSQSLLGSVLAAAYLSLFQMLGTIRKAACKT